MGMRRLASLLVLITALGVGLPSVYRTVHRRFFGVNHGVYLAVSYTHLDVYKRQGPLSPTG